MPITFKSERKKILKRMYYDMCDEWLVEVKKNRNLTDEQQDEMQKDVTEWKVEFKKLIEAL